MVGWVRTCLGLLLFAGCNAPASFSCQDDAGCGAGGHCEPTGFCSFLDPKCPSGRRYGELAGAGLTGLCVALNEGSTGDLDSTSTSATPPGGCTPGVAFCACDDQGRCMLGLECTVNVCLPTGSASVGTSEAGSSSSGSAGSSSTTFSTMGTSSTTEIETTTEPSDTTDMPVSCGEEVSCEGCFACTDTNECTFEFGACDAVNGCFSAVTCMGDCSVNGLCFDDCCAGESEGFRVAAEALHSCRIDTCIIGPCKDYVAIPDGYCGS